MIVKKRVLGPWGIVLSLLGFVLCVVLQSFASTNVANLPRLLEVTGILEEVTPEGNGGTVTLNVYGKLASGPLSADCRFWDERGQPMDKLSFLQRYMKRVVTLDLEADSGEVVSCRVGS